MHQNRASPVASDFHRRLGYRKDSQIARLNRREDRRSLAFWAQKSRFCRILRIFLCLEIGQFSPHCGVIALLNFTENLEKGTKIHWRKFKIQCRNFFEIAEVCRWSWLNVSWDKGTQQFTYGVVREGVVAVRHPKLIVQKMCCNVIALGQRAHCPEYPFIRDMLWAIYELHILLCLGNVGTELEGFFAFEGGSRQRGFTIVLRQPDQKVHDYVPFAFARR